MSVTAFQEPPAAVPIGRSDGSRDTLFQTDTTSMIQLILHLIGDYVLQSDWMAQNKTKRFAPAAAHAIVYSLPFLLLKPSLTAFMVILVTHFLIDRYRLARYVVWVKNCALNPASFKHGWPAEMMVTGFPDEADSDAHHKSLCWSNCSGTGYPSDAPPWLAVWLLIAADNTLHLAINYAALRWL